MLLDPETFGHFLVHYPLDMFWLYARSNASCILDPQTRRHFRAMFALQNWTTWSSKHWPCAACAAVMPSRYFFAISRNLKYRARCYSFWADWGCMQARSPESNILIQQPFDAEDIAFDFEG